MTDSISLVHRLQPRWGASRPRRDGWSLGQRVLHGLGRALLTSGVLILLFVTYQLWGTGLAEARSQRALAEQLEEAAAAVPQPQPAGDSGPDTPRSQATPALLPPPAPRPGKPVGTIAIPRIGIEKLFVEGVSVGDLKKGPGHHPGTAFPGHAGNAVIAGHRTTYGAPFFRLDELRPGDPVIVTSPRGNYRYEVMESKVVQPSDVWILDPTVDDRLTLYTCTPRFSAAQRLVVTARLTTPLPPTPDRPEAAPQPQPDPDPGGFTGEGETLTAGVGSVARTAAHAVAVAALAAAARILGRLWRRWPSYVAAAPALGVALFLLFEQLNELFPSSI